MNDSPKRPGRRRFLASGGALTLSFALPLRAAPGALPGSLEREPWLDAWIRVGSDNRVSIFTGKVELGQGIKTALLQVAAHERARGAGEAERARAVQLRHRRSPSATAWVHRAPLCCPRDP